MTPEPQTTAETRPDDTAPAPTGRHVADGTTMPSIRSFIGGRHPRHRAEDRDR